MDAELTEAAGLLSDLVSIYSPSGGEGQVVDHVEDLCRRAGLSVRRVPAEVGRDSLVLGAAREPVLAIAAHLDTITPTWPDATSPRVEDSVLHGLGSVDDKGGVASCLLAALWMKRSGIDLDRLPAVFAFPVDEETGGSGSRSLAIDLAPRFAIALEGTELNAGTVECGDLEALVHVRGVSAHGSLAELGDNAIHSAAAFIASLDELGLEAHSHPVLGRSLASVTEIETGGGMNVIPDTCTLRLRIRMVPGQDLAEAIRDVESLAARFGADIQMVEGTAPFELPGDSPLRLAVDSATESVTGRRPETIGVPAWTDAHNFVDFGGSEAMVFGPGSIDSAHTPAEHVELDQVVQCAKIFMRLLSEDNLAAMSAADPRPDQPRYRRTR
ncbi:MAG: M20/M25/M40 family metallo-hydrolase [Solirubrobacterales bacterium]|nr:M20/M25/M40 family metallo-hydrolase [Solirubrobacterales bacterium]